MSTRTVAMLSFLLVGSCALADWPQIGGPDRNSVSSEKGLLQQWPEQGPEMLWSKPLGAGFGGPSVRDGEVYVLDRVDDQKDVLRCLELKTGKELWTFEYDAPGKYGFNGSRAVPTISDKYVYTVGPFGQLYCVDRKTHQPKWNKSAMGANPGKLPWAMAQSPLLVNDLVVTSGPGMAGMTAYNQETGEVAWEAKSIPGMPFAGIAAVKLGGTDQLVMVNSKGVSAVDPATGKDLWNFPNFKCGIPIPHPVQVGENRLFVTGGYRSGSVMLEYSSDNKSVKELWRIPEGSQIHQPILLDGAIYLNGNTNETPRQGFTCVDAETGKVLWASADPGLDRGNVIYADGRFYAMGATGTLHLIAPSKEGIKVVSSTEQLKPKEVWAPMAISDGVLVVRDQREMKALKVGQ